MIFLPKCRPFYVVLEKGHGAVEKGMALEKRAWRGAMLKLARGNTKSTDTWAFLNFLILLARSHFLHSYMFLKYAIFYA